MNDTTFSYLTDFYGPSARWYGLFMIVVTLIVFSSDLFFVTMTLTSKYLRSVVANYFLIGFALSDMFHCVVNFADGIHLLNASIDDR